MQEKKPGAAKSLGELLMRRRLELGLTQAEVARRLKGRTGARLAVNRYGDIEQERRGAPRLAILKQLPRALRLDADAVYFWGGQLPPDIKVGGISEAAVKEAWAALRGAIAQHRARHPAKVTHRQVSSEQLRGSRLRGWRGRATLGGLLEWRRRQLGLTRRALGARIKSEEGGALSEERLSDIETDRFGVPRRRLLLQLARALQLDIDVLYLWARRIPPDIKPGGMPEAAITEAWDAFRAVLAKAKARYRRK